MLASAIPKPREVTLHWLRLCGIIALTMLGISVFFWTRRIVSQRFELISLGGIGLLVLLQLALVQTAKPIAARIPSLIAAIASVPLAVQLLRTPVDVPYGAAIVGCAGVGAICGIVLMEMLLGHAYLTAAKMTIAPFRRMNLVLAAVMALRMFFALCGMLMEQRWPVELFWTREGFLIGTRWFVGLLVPSVFIYMTHDCIKRRSTQSATGILYVAAVLIFIGEMIALNLTRETGLPF
jgi:hypothetical protein